jgi:hypothetical protein
MEWEKIFANLYLIMNEYPEYIKNSYNSPIKTQPIKEEERDK